jgi:hypothetical protein
MKKLLLILFFASITMLVHANSYFKFAFTVTGGSGNEYECFKSTIDNPTLVATGQSPVGTNAPSYGGHQYSIDTVSNNLLVDGEVVNVIKWGSNTVDVQHYFGFAIDHQGNGWLFTQYNDGDLHYYVFEINLADATATYAGQVGNIYPNAVNGLIIQQYP